MRNIGGFQTFVLFLIFIDIIVLALKMKQNNLYILVNHTIYNAVIVMVIVIASMTNGGERRDRVYAAGDGRWGHLHVESTHYPPRRQSRHATSQYPCPLLSTTPLHADTIVRTQWIHLVVARKC